VEKKGKNCGGKGRRLRKPDDRIRIDICIRILIKGKERCPKGREIKGRKGPALRR